MNQTFKDKLRNLKDQGKIVFIISNNWAVIGEQILIKVMGEDFQDYFDFIIFDANKPKFMYDEIEEDFYYYHNG